MGKAKVLVTFRDKDSFTRIYEEGSEIELSDERLENLEKRGLVEIIEKGKKITISINAGVDLSKNKDEVLQAIAKVDTAEELQSILEAEKVRKKGARKTVMAALEAKIATLEEVENDEKKEDLNPDRDLNGEGVDFSKEDFENDSDIV